MLLKPKRHSLRRHGFVVHALLLRMCACTPMLYISELCEDCAVANEIDYEIDDAWTKAVVKRLTEPKPTV